MTRMKCSFHLLPNEAAQLPTIGAFGCGWVRLGAGWCGTVRFGAVAAVQCTHEAAGRAARRSAVHNILNTKTKP